MITALAKDHKSIVRPKLKAPEPPTREEKPPSNQCNTCPSRNSHIEQQPNWPQTQQRPSTSHAPAQPLPRPPSPTQPWPRPPSGEGFRPPLVRQQSYYDPSYEENFTPEPTYDTSDMMARDPYYQDEQRYPYRQDSMFGSKYKQPMGRLPHNRRASRQISKKPSQQQR